MQFYDLSYATDSKFEPIYPTSQKLFPFQKAGVEYLTKIERALLADEMGLGKTAQAIIALQTLGIQRYIVVAPASLCENWRLEILKWSIDSQPVHIFKPNKKTPKNCKLILSFGLCSQRDIIAHILKNFNFDGCIIDESHFLKNPVSARTRFLLAKHSFFDRSKFIFALSGTPILNRPLDIFPVVSRLNPNVFDQKTMFEFGSYFCESYYDTYAKQIKFRGLKNEKELNFRLRSNVMCRRLKEDVLKDLPPKIIRTIYLDKNKEIENYLDAESKLYDTFLNSHLTKDETKILFAVRQVLGLLKVRQASAYIKMILEEQEKILVFGWHREVLARLTATLAEFNPLILTGATPKEDRQSRVNLFQTDPKHRVFIGAIPAAGVGLNLFAASHVVMVEQSWTPAENEQAIDRAHRIGQKSCVTVDYLIFSNSVDERVLKVVSQKSRTIKKILNTKEKEFEK